MSRKGWTRVAGVTVSLLCLGYFFARAAALWRTSGVSILDAKTLTGFGLALVPYALGYVLFPTAWNQLLRGLGFPARLRTSLAIYLTSQFGKYLPGNVGHLAGRVVLAGRNRYPTTLVTSSMLLETSVFVSVSAVLGLPFLGSMWLPRVRAWAGSPRVIAGVLAVAVLGLLAALWAARAFGLVEKLRQALGGSFARLRSPAFAGAVASAFGLAVVGFALCGAPMLLVTGTPLSQAMAHVPYAVGLYSMTWVAGSITPGAPAGLGVRDALLSAGLAPILGPGPAVVATLLFRLLTTVADLLAFAAGAWLLRGAPATPAPASP